MLTDDPRRIEIARQLEKSETKMRAIARVLQLTREAFLGDQIAVTADEHELGDPHSLAVVQAGVFDVLAVAAERSTEELVRLYGQHAIAFLRLVNQVLNHEGMDGLSDQELDVLLEQAVVTPSSSAMSTHSTDTVYLPTSPSPQVE